LLALQERRPSAVVALIRGASDEAAQAKLRVALRGAAESYRSLRDHAAVASGARILLGDISIPDCGVPADSESAIASAGIDEFWHFAASLSFEEKNRDVIAAQNIGGARNAVSLAVRLRARRFIYVSTAYTAGKKTGAIPETLHDTAGPFNNYYEESKCAAEHLVTELCAAAGIALTILRPSIVIGPSETKLSGGSNSGVYGFIREMNRLTRTLQNWTGDVRISASADTALNVIPVDNFIDDIFHVIGARFDVGPILHLTSSANPTVETCIQTIAAGLGIKNLKLYQGPKDGFSPLEELLDRRIVFYGGYIDGEKTFERSLPAAWEITNQDYRSFVVEGIRDARRESINRLFTRGTAKSFDGASLATYACGAEAGTPVVLVNALGMPAAFWTRVAARLAGRYRILSWETRGVPSFTENFGESDCGVDTHVGDLVAVMKAHGMEKAHVVGWCTGALIALRAAYRAPERVESLVLLNGNFSLGTEHPRTQFERNMRLAMPKVASSRKTAEIYYRTIYLPQRQGAVDAQEAEAHAQTMQLLTSTDPDLIHLTSVPFDSVDALHRYGRLITEAFKEDAAPWARDVKCRAFVASGERDTTAHPDGSRFLASQLPSAKLEIYPDMDHYGLFGHERLSEDIAAFLDAQRPTGSTERAVAALEA
jgi:pimeloyl-ACP methyl ester carboxylesterase/nucleoside-diphosphate-sugar epimerase